MFNTNSVRNCTVLFLSVSVMCSALMAAPEVPAKGLAAEGEKRWDDAVSIYKEVLSEEPKRGDLWQRIADIEASRGNLAEAAEALTAASKAVKDDSDLYFRAAKAWSHAEKPKKALEAVNAALEIDAGNMEYLRAKALYAGWMGSYDVSIETYQLILAADPDEHEALLGLQAAAAGSGTEAAKLIVAEALGKAAELNPRDDKLQFRAAQAYSGADKPDKALKAVEMAIKRDPKNLEYLRAKASYANWLGEVGIAAEAYKAILEVDPNDETALVGLQGALSWEEKSADYELVAQSIEKKIKANPNDPELRFQLAQAHALADKPDLALEAIEKAVELQPDNLHYLLARGQYANWLGNTKLAEESFLRVVELAPDDEVALLNLARARAWGGKLDAAVRAFKRYMEKHPENGQALMDYIKVQGWRGNYSAAMVGLDDYKEDFGPSIEYRKQLARVLASADKPSAALAEVDELLETLEPDYELLFTKTSAFRNGARHRDALEGLDKLTELRPDSEDTDSMRRYVENPLSHYLRAVGSHYKESSGSIEITTYGGDAGVHIAPELRIMVGYTLRGLTAEIGSGLDSIDGRNPVYTRDRWLGANAQVVPSLNLEARVGETVSWTSSETNAQITSYSTSLAYRPVDALRVSLGQDKQIFATSPRSVSLGIARERLTGNLVWTPGFKTTVDVGGSDSDYSDGNTGWELYFAPRFALLRTERWNVDMGPYCWWLGFSEDSNNGYYSPEYYERYALKTDAYLKINEKNGVALVFVVGEQKEEDGEDAEFGTSGDIDGQFTLFDDWLLRLRYGYTHNMNNVIGNFNARTYAASLEKKF